ncbi:uncharacterized protein LOC110057699 [Orbicella faveolata]|uniref:uncharacterized protein LOC110057699 n=1 Tax=Orbicella faveolata TaxID=48498 RepID=UPI0009E18C83|nr:uncharacterized protein LOC110057699 [Orbicella faveolata]
MMTTPSVDVVLKIIPTNVAVELKMYAEKHSLHCAKIRRGKQITEADADLSEARTRIAFFKEKCKGWLSDKSCLQIEKMLEYAGWHAADTKKSDTCWRRGSRKGYENDASINKRLLEQHYQNVVKEKEISETLAANVRDMGWAAAWFAVNTIFGHQEEAKRQKEKLDLHFDKIHGEIHVAEILSQRPQIDNDDNATFGDIEPLEILPQDVAEELKQYAEKAAWSCSKRCFGGRGEADAHKIEATDHFHSFRKKCNGLLSDRSCEDIRSMIKNVASYVTNKTISKKRWWITKRNQYKAYAVSCEGKFHAKNQDIVNRGEISQTLATYLLELGRNAALLATHTIVGRHDDAKRDQANLAWYFNKIHGEINLVAMNFILDEAKILSQTPKVVSKRNLVNNSDVDQAMTFSFSMTEGKTHSTSHTIGFRYGINSSFKAGFSGFGEVNFELSFSFSHSHTFEQSTRTGTTKSVEFPLSVPAHSTYVATGMVSEAEMEIPYELVFDFGGAHRKLRGHWKGIACSKAEYQVDRLPGPRPAEENDVE